MLDEEEIRSSNLSPLILFGVLSIICAEVFSGSAPLWMWDLWGLLGVLPLYWGHGLILWNIALRFRKTSVIHLYILGIIYGLYESWMTKVIWAGYMGQDPQFGQILGFAIGEFLVIALFWHAIFSFIIPLFVTQILGSSEGQFAFTKQRKAFFVIIVIIGSMFLTKGLWYDPGATLLAVASNGFLLGLAFLLTRKRHPEGFSLESLRLGKAGLGITIAYTLFLYVFLFFTLLPERIAPPITLILTVMFYVLVIVLFVFSEEKEYETDAESEGDTILPKHVLLGLVLVFLLSFFWIAINPLTEIIAVFLYLSWVLAGPMLFLIALVKVILRKM